MPRRKKYVPPHMTLSDTEKRLLEYPPNEDTWKCEAKKEYGVCNFPNPGRYDACQFCGAAKPNRPLLIWPEYIVACNKVNIEPKRALWRESPHSGRPMIREFGKKWVLWEEPEAPEVETITRVRKGKVRTRTTRRTNAGRI